MTLDQYRTINGLTWQTLTRHLSELSRSYGEDPIYYHRLWQLRGGLKTPKSNERRALLELTDNEVQSYKD